MKTKFDKFCSSKINGDRDAARLYFKIVETYILMDEYNIDFYSILNKKVDHLEQIRKENLYDFLFQMWDN
jgi:hypothetical protein